jgi:two-component system CheB/CheR fusion protein
MISRTNSAASRAAAPLRVLLVENHADTREFLTSMLEGLGHTVIVAESMGNALRAAARSGCDVLISDIGLPDGDGWELLNRLNLPRPMYAIAMSGYGTLSDRNRSKAAGYRHHLVKPMELEQLESILHSVAVALGSSGGQHHGARTSLGSG